MTREYFQDILPPEEASEGAPAPSPRSIRNIAPSNARPRVSRVSESGPARRAPRPKRRGYLLWGLVIIALVILGIAILTLFQPTTVTLVPREHTVVFDQQATYSAYPSTTTTAPSGSLSYTTETKAFTDSAPVTTSGTEQASDTATGVITIYNAYSSSSVPLIKDTRFETPDGKVFRIKNPVTVPGKTSAGPGSVSAGVYADQPGADYNIGPVERFTVPGLKDNAAMYAGIYGHSDAAMTGGFVGTRPSITDAARAAVETQLEQSIKADIIAAYATDTESYALVPLAKVTYAPLAVSTGADGSAQASLSANVVMPLLSRSAVDSFLAAETDASTDSSKISIADPSTFSFVPSDASSTPDLGNDPIDFSLNGTVVFVWSIDTDALAKDLAGRDKSAFESIVAGYPSIDSATAKVYPLWSQTFPTDPSKIKMVVTPPKAAPQA